MSWWRWVGSDGDVLGLDRFGASAPGTTVLEKLGFTAENIAARARALLARGRPTEGDRHARAPRRPAAAPVRARAERVGRLPLARVDPRRAPAGADRRRRGRGRDVEPDDLPEGDERRGTPTTSSSTSSPTRGCDADADLLGARRAGHQGGVRRVPPGLGARAPAATATSRSRSTRAWPTTRSRPSARRCACTRRSTAPT